MDKHSKIVVTGAAGLLGQNLVTELVHQGFDNITALDKHANNLHILQQMHPAVTCIHADLSEGGAWEESFANADTLFLLQAQITGLTFDVFEKNTLSSTKNVIRAAQKAQIPFTVFVGSSVENSVADDNYTRSKKMQLELMKESGLTFCTARPTLMFGWFDPKHLGWLSRFMAKIPVFPIPGHGRYIRQPLYVLDFCRVLIACANTRPAGKIYDIVGEEDVTYIDIIRTIKRVKKLHTLIINLPVPFFKFLMNVYALFSKNPPFVADQLDALMAGDYFTGHSMEKEFGIKPTPFAEAIRETYTNPKYCNIVLERTK